MKKSLFRMLGILFFAFAAGLIGGIFGTGGGILIVFLFSRIYAKSEKYTAQDCFAMTVCCMSVSSVVSLLIYLRNGSFSLSDLNGIALPAALGGMVGAYLLDRIPLRWIRKGFAGFIIYAGFILLFR